MEGSLLSALGGSLFEGACRLCHGPGGVLRSGGNAVPVSRTLETDSAGPADGSHELVDVRHGTVGTVEVTVDQAFVLSG